MSKPNKILWMLGYNNLGLILEQERKHWLMKTDKNKQNQDKATGDIFQGQIDNIATDIIVESKKLPYSYAFIQDIRFTLSQVNEILEISNSGFPHSAETNGLCMSVIKSINYRGSNNEHRNYKVRFDDCEECVLLFGINDDTDGVFATRWIKTSTVPKLLIADDDNQYTIERDLAFTSNVTNPVWYYPLDESLQPIGIGTISGDSYTLNAVDDNELIGFPLYWFTCDNSAVGTNITYTDNVNKTLYVGNDATNSGYECKVFTDIDGIPDGSVDTNFDIIIHSKNLNAFTDNLLSDSLIPLSNVITFDDTVNGFTYDITINTDNDSVFTLTMNGNINSWEYVDANTYKIPMAVFTVNRIDNVNQSTLLHMLNMQLDTSIPYAKSVTDHGVSGIRMSSSNLKSDKYEEYPLNLNRIEGLPDWMNNLDDDIVPEHLIAYAYHFPPTYDPARPSTMQGAGLIVDPGKITNDPNNPDSVGRVYVLSNDDIEYHNNENEAEYTKPALTAARICDIPTSIFDLNGVRGVSVDPIVDKQYVRTKCSYTEDDRERLYNTLQSRWVRPTAVNNEGVMVNFANGTDGVFAFDSLDMLNQVDMYHVVNGFRIKTNLNPMVDVNRILQHVGVHNAGSGYAVNDTCVCIIGGYSFTVKINTVGSNGSVTDASIVIDGTSTDKISLSNFDNVIGDTSGVYQTSPTNGCLGSDFSLYINFDTGYIDSISESYGEFYPDLFALVRDPDGICSYVYKISETSYATPKPGVWTRDMLLSQLETNTTDKSAGGLSTKDSYLNNIIPSIRELPVTMKSNQLNETSIKVVQTGSMLTVIDTTYTPVSPDASSDDEIDLSKVVDITKWYSDGVRYTSTMQPGSRSDSEVIEYLKDRNELRFDSYVIWRWVNLNDISDHRFYFAIIHRGFNNLFSTDVTTMLPANELNCDNYVHLNNQTTLVWNVPGIGPMTWVYDPTYDKKESYFINPETMELNVVREKITFNDIDFVSFAGNAPHEVYEDDGVRTKALYNIFTNNPHAFNYINRSNVIYQQPNMTPLYYINGYVSGKQLCGNWRLVYPRVNTYTFEDDTTDTHHVPMKLQVIKNRSIAVGSDTKIFDDDGNDITTKNIVFNETNDGIKLLVFNTATGKWEEINKKK